MHAKNRHLKYPIYCNEDVDESFLGFFEHLKNIFIYQQTFKINSFSDNEMGFSGVIKKLIGKETDLIIFMRNILSIKKKYSIPLKVINTKFSYGPDCSAR